MKIGFILEYFNDIALNIYLPNLSGWVECGTRSILSGALQAWIKSFPSPRLVAIPRLKSSVCPTIYLKLEGEQMDSFVSQEHKRSVKCKQCRSGFELGSLCPFQTRATTLYLIILLWCAISAILQKKNNRKIELLTTKHIHIIGQMGRVFAKGLGDRGSIPGWVIQKT